MLLDRRIDKGLKYPYNKIFENYESILKNSKELSKLQQYEEFRQPLTPQELFEKVNMIIDLN